MCFFFFFFFKLRKEKVRPKIDDRSYQFVTGRSVVENNAWQGVMAVGVGPASLIMPATCQGAPRTGRAGELCPYG